MRPEYQIAVGRQLINLWDKGGSAMDSRRMPPIYFPRSDAGNPKSGSQRI